MQIEAKPLDPISLALHENALACAKRFLVAEVELLDAILAVDRHRIYEQFALPALTPYCVKVLKLSEEVAACFVRVARKCDQVPILRKALADGRITLFKARVIAGLLTPENAPHWIDRAKSLSKEKLDDEVRAAQGVAGRRIKLRLTKEQFQLLQRARDLVSRSLGREATWEEAIHAALEAWLEKEDPLRKVERNKSESGNHRSRDRSPRETLHLPSRVRHQVNRRDKGQCQARLPDGSQCENRRWTHFHHVVPKCDGGPDTAENLVTLCSAHHQQWHRQSH